MLLAGADPLYCTNEPVLGPTASKVPMLYFCAANALWTATPLLLAAGGNMNQKFCLKEGEEEQWLWSGKEQAMNMLSQMAELEDNFVTSGGLKIYYTLLAFEGTTSFIGVNSGL